MGLWASRLWSARLWASRLWSGATTPVIIAVPAYTDRHIITRIDDNHVSQILEAMYAVSIPLSLAVITQIADTHVFTLVPNVGMIKAIKEKYRVVPRGPIDRHILFRIHERVVITDNPSTHVVTLRPVIDTPVEVNGMFKLSLTEDLHVVKIVDDRYSIMVDSPPGIIVKKLGAE